MSKTESVRILERLGIPGPRTVDRVMDVAVVVAVAIASSPPFVDARPGEITWLGVVFTLGTVIPLLWRRRFPFVVMVIVATAATLVSAHDHPGQSLQYGGLVAIYTLASLGHRRWQRRGLLVLILVTFPPASLLLKHNDLAEFMFTCLLPVAAFMAGSLERSHREYAAVLRERTARLEQERRTEAARAAAEERARVARDMHDILAHAVTLMIVQAEAGPVVVRTDPDRAEQTFDAIADAGRDAMVQLRRLLGVLKPGESRAPQPTLADLPELVRSVQFAETGVRRPVSRDTEVAIYRIVQEALTNSRKHAQATRIGVGMHWSTDQVVLTITDNGVGGKPAPGGHGLVGIRERAGACGGTATAGPQLGGGFEVRAEIPCSEQVS
ncbi:sensor histidine kinase [Kribbella sp. NPDC051586]|uniref:sensor histidine kinase n=1 Tax=Kribbella sp. NPDC051586 TaxID=3364118 RepID=UPI0037897F18